MRSKRNEEKKIINSAALFVLLPMLIIFCCFACGQGPIFASGTVTFGGLGESGETVYLNELPSYVSIDAENAEQVDVTVGNGSEILLNETISNGSSISLSSNIDQDGEYEITASWVDSEIGDAQEESLTFYYDTVGPDVSITGAESGEKRNSAANIRVSASDEVGLETSETAVTAAINGKEYDITEDATGSGFDADEEGNYTIKAEAKDKAGNVTTKTLSFTIDKTKPEIEITGDANGYVKSMNQLSAKSSSNDTVKVLLSATCEGEPSLNNAADGKEVTLTGDPAGTVSNEKWTVTATAIDDSGNIGTLTKNIIKDNKAPSVDFTGAENGKYYNHDIDIEGVIDEPNIDTYSMTVKLNGSLIGNSKDLTRHLTNDGKYDITLQVEDKCGQSTMKQISFIIDTKAPVLDYSGSGHDGEGTLLQTETGGYYHDISSVTVKANEKSDIELSVSKESDNIKGEDSITYKNFTADGDYEFIATATDLAGNKSTPYAYKVTKDSKDPEIKVSGVEDGKYYNVDVHVKAEVKDDNLKKAVMEVTRNGEKIDNEDLDQTFTKEGEYKLVVKASDKAKNSASSKHYTFVIDKTPPVTKFSGEDNHSYRISPKEVEASANEEATVEMTVTKDGKDFKSKKGKNSVAFSEYGGDGVYRFTAKSIDLAGNVGESVTWTVTKDTTPPEVTISGVKEGKYYNYDVTPETTYVELYPKTAKMVITRDGRELSSEALTQTLSAEGHYEINSTVVDKAGNSTTKSVKFVIDKTPPRTTISGVVKDKHYRSVPDVTAKSNETGTVYMTVTRDGVKIYSGSAKNSKTFGAFNKDGDYVVSAYSIDLATNRGKVSRIAFVKDSTAPVITLSGATEGSFYNNARSIQIKVHERYYKTNKVNVNAYYVLNGKRTNVPFSFNSTGIDSTNVLHAGQTGEYHITVTAKDEVGNTAIQKSLTFKVDTKKPKIEIKIPKKVSSYNDLVTPRVEIEDDYFKSKSITIKKTSGAGEGIVRNNAFKDDFGSKGGTRQYFDFPKQKINDGTYTITVAAEDKAGNTNTASMDFTVDRFGSVFSVIQKPDEKYMKELDNDIEIREMNVAGIDSYKVIIRHDSSGMKAKNVIRNVNGIYTTYIIPKENFEEEGFYRINIRTTDKAGNVSELSDDEDNAIFFAIDKTPPTIMASGVSERTLYKESSVRLDISSTDTVSKDTNLKVLVNGKEQRIRSDEKGSYVIIQGGYNQKIEIEATDDAGNVETKTIENVSVSKDVLAPLYANKALMAGAIAGAGGLIIAAVYLIARKRRKSKPQDDIVF